MNKLNLVYLKGGKVGSWEHPYILRDKMLGSRSKML